MRGSARPWAISPSYPAVSATPSASSFSVRLPDKAEGKGKRRVGVTTIQETDKRHHKGGPTNGAHLFQDVDLTFDESLFVLNVPLTGVRGAR
jgi:hypothetical protein